MIEYKKDTAYNEKFMNQLFEEMKMIYSCKFNSCEIWTKDMGYSINNIFINCALGAGYTLYPRRTIYSMCHFHDCTFRDEPSMFINCKFDNCNFENKDKMHFQNYTIHELKGE